MTRLLSIILALFVALPATGRDVFTINQNTLDALVEEITPLVEKHTGRVFASPPEARLVDARTLDTASVRAMWRGMAPLMDANAAFEARKKAPREPSDAQREALRHLGALQYHAAKNAMGLEPFDRAVAEGSWPTLHATAEGAIPAFAMFKRSNQTGGPARFATYIPAERAILVSAERFTEFSTQMESDARDLARAGIAHELTRALQDEQLDALALEDAQRSIWSLAAIRRTADAHALLVEGLVSAELGMANAQAELARALKAQREPLTALSASLYSMRAEHGDARVWDTLRTPPMYSCEYEAVASYDRTSAIPDHREAIRQSFFKWLTGNVVILAPQFREPLFLTAIAPAERRDLAARASSFVVEDAVQAAVRGDGASFLLSATSFFDEASAAVAYDILRVQTLDKAMGIPEQMGAERTGSATSYNVIEEADESAQVLVTSASEEGDLRTTALAFRAGRFVGTLTITEPELAAPFRDMFVEALLGLARSLPCVGG